MTINTIELVNSLTSANGDVNSGTNQFIFNQTTGQIEHAARGTTASPETTNLDPLIKSVRTMAFPDSGGASDDGEKLSSIVGISYAIDPMVGQPVGVFGGAKNTSTQGPGVGGRRNDAVGVYGIGISDGPPAGTGLGAFFQGRRNQSSGDLIGAEISAANYSNVAGTYNASGFSGTAGIWLTAQGTANSGVGISLGNPFGYQFSVGLGFTGQVTGGVTGPAKDYTIRDDGNATTSIAINGTHTYGIDLNGGKCSNGAIRLGNGFTAGNFSGAIIGRDATDSFDIEILTINSSNIIGIGAAAVSINLSAIHLTFDDGVKIVFGSTAGTQIGSQTTQKFGFWGATPITQPAAITAPSGGATIDVQARTAINSILAVLSAASGGVGLTA